MMQQGVDKMSFLKFKAFLMNVDENQNVSSDHHNDDDNVLIVSMKRITVERKMLPPPTLYRTIKIATTQTVPASFFVWMHVDDITNEQNESCNDKLITRINKSRSV